ncbi:diguanylate cyclase [Acuticoccus sp. M5D2P5]|nr:diguanylate cyclase [Acuticoccus kalidii]
MGSGAILSMLDPSELIPGVIVDSRSTIVTLSGFFGGPITAGITWAMTAAYRYHLGGVGMPAGQLAICGAVVLGLVGHYLVRRAGRSVRTSDVAMLAIASPFLTLSMLTLPRELAVVVIETTAAPLALVTLLGTAVLGLFILHEVRRVEAETEVRRLAFVDELSGLANRRAFYIHLNKTWARWERYRNPMSIILIDIDYFKSINDRFGHATGDEVIRLLARLMAEAARTADIPARIGGEEFVILLPNTSSRAALSAAERIRAMAEQQVIEIEGDVIHFTISLGVSADIESHKSVQDCLSSADQALYEAKRSGRNRAILATPKVTTVEPAMTVSGPVELIAKA